jgi:amidohydrolase
MEIEQDIIQEITDFRRKLHREPEVSGNEYNTSKKIQSKLKLLDPDEIVHLGATGLAAIFKGKEEGPSILFRCELDALPIQEINQFDHRSEHDGVSHKCGHDGHMAIMTGLATVVSKNRPKKGRVILLYQPAEEDGRGARSVIEDSNFSKIKPDYVYALHNLPGFPKGQIAIKNGTFTAAAKSMISKWNGKTSHAAEPEKGLNPAYPIAQVLTESENVVVKDPTHEKFRLITPIHINLGEKAYGVSAGYGELHLTFRSFSNDLMNQLTNDMMDLTQKASKEFQIPVDISWTEVFSANQNAPEAIDKVRKSARDEELDIIELKTPFKWGEDFGLFTEKYHGAMFGIGSGEDCPALHNPDYDFPDEIIEPAVKTFYGILNQHLKE